MPTSTANYGWANPADGDPQGAAELAITATINAIDADLTEVASGLGTIPADDQHIEATLRALIRDLYSRYYLLATTRPVDVTDSGGNFVKSAGRNVIVRR
jgi:hypothetical protein